MDCCAQCLKDVTRLFHGKDDRWLCHQCAPPMASLVDPFKMEMWPDGGYIRQGHLQDIKSRKYDSRTGEVSRDSKKVYFS